MRTLSEWDVTMMRLVWEHGSLPVEWLQPRQEEVCDSLLERGLLTARVTNAGVELRPCAIPGGSQ